MTWTGISGVIVVVASIPMVKAVAKTARIPKCYLPGLIMAGSSAAMAGPGSPCIGNITASGILGTPSTSALIPGLIGSAFIFFAALFYMYFVICRGIDKGVPYEGFDNEEHTLSKPKQNFVFTLIPLLFVFVTYSLLQLELVICMVGAIVLALLLFCVVGAKEKHFSYGNTVGMLNDGIKTGAYVYFTVAALMGFASVVQATDSFQTVIGFVTSLPGHPLLIGTISVVVFTLLTASPPAAIQLALLHLSRLSSRALCLPPPCTVLRWYPPLRLNLCPTVVQLLSRSVPVAQHSGRATSIVLWFQFLSP